MNLFHKIGLSQKVFKEAEFEGYDGYGSEDLIHGALKNNCKFAMSEVWTLGKSYKSSVYSPIFSGLFAKVETPKTFNTLLYLRKDKKDTNLINKVFLDRTFLLGGLPPDKLRIQMDSQKFEEIFDVYASDKIIAMQLLTADIMQYLVQFHKETGIDYELTIKNNCMYIRFWSGKIFSGTMFEPAKLEKFSLDRDTLYKYYRILDFTFGLTNRMIKLLKETQYD